MPRDELSDVVGLKSYSRLLMLSFIHIAASDSFNYVSISKW